MTFLINCACRPRVRIRTVVGCLLLTSLATPVAGQPATASGTGEIHTIEVVAGRYSFAPDTIEIDEGERVRLLARSVDVAHGLAIDALGVDVEIPADGRTVTIDLGTPPAGSYGFTCSVFCGTGHGRMTGTLIVGPADGTTPAVAATEPDFTVITLATTKRLPRLKSAFRLTHRFTRPLGQGDFGSLAEDLFGLDSSAFVGLEFRIGLVDGTQAGIYRASNRTIQFFGQHRLFDQQRHGVGLDVILSVEGTNNFRNEYLPAIGAVVSRSIGDRATVYAQPTWVGNTNIEELLHPTGDPPGDGESTFMVGLGSRVRLTRRLYLLGEIVPRAAGFSHGDAHATFGLETRVGGHAFQLNFSNSLGTTLGQLAQGGSEGDWFIGFNITRTFF